MINQMNDPTCIIKTQRKLVWLTASKPPLTAIEIRPVSSETTTVTASRNFEIPIAALWREPYFPANGFVLEYKTLLAKISFP